MHRISNLEVIRIETPKETFVAIQNVPVPALVCAHVSFTWDNSFKLHRIELLLNACEDYQLCYPSEFYPANQEIDDLLIQAAVNGYVASFTPDVHSNLIQKMKNSPSYIKSGVRLG
jgi:hypothetical protein